MWASEGAKILSVWYQYKMVIKSNCQWQFFTTPEFDVPDYVPGKLSITGEENPVSSQTTMPTPVKPVPMFKPVSLKRSTEPSVYQPTKRFPASSTDLEMSPSKTSKKKQEEYDPSKPEIPRIPCPDKGFSHQTYHQLSHWWYFPA